MIRDLKPLAQELVCFNFKQKHDQNDINSAIKSIKRTLKLDKRNANAYFLLGNAKLIQKKHINALQAFETANELNPNLWQAMNNKGLIYFELGNLNNIKTTKIPKSHELKIIREDIDPQGILLGKN